jgi:hypothetical protein
MGSFQNRVEKLEEGKSRGSLGDLVKKGVILLVVLGILYYVFVAEGVRSPADFVEMIKGFMP